MSKQKKMKVHKKKTDLGSYSDHSGGNSQNLSALGGGNARNPSSSGSSGSSQSNSQSSKAHSNAVGPSDKNIKKVPPSDQKVLASKRQSVSLDKLNLADMGNIMDDKGLVPINFGSAEMILKNKKRKMTNKVRTTKYTWVTWAPLSLLLQFKRAANIYFLIISVLTLMPFSPKTPSSMIGTFTFVLFVTMLKEALENYFRYKADKEANGRL
jgi:hypothetical protein